MPTGCMWCVCGHHQFEHSVNPNGHPDICTKEDCGCKRFRTSEVAVDRIAELCAKYRDDVIFHRVVDTVLSVVLDGRLSIEDASGVSDMMLLLYAAERAKEMEPKTIRTKR